jgi:hypothetical protein
MGYLLSGAKGDMWTKEAVNSLQELARVISNSTSFFFHGVCPKKGVSLKFCARGLRKPLFPFSVD